MLNRRWRDAGVSAHVIGKSWQSRVAYVSDQETNIIEFVDTEFFDGNDPLLRLDEFLTACVPQPSGDHRSGNFKLAKRFLTERPELASASIHAACAVGLPEEVRLWIERDSSLIDQRGGPHHWKPLSYLAFSLFLRDEPERAEDFAQCAKLLLDAGADPNTEWHPPDQPDHRESALYGAAGLANCAPLTKLLLDAGADVNDSESLYHAAENPDHASLELLLQAKPRLAHMSFCMCHNMDCEDPDGLRLFIRYGADVNHRLNLIDIKGGRPLHFAILRGRSIEVIRILLDAGADLSIPADAGITPYRLARMLGSTAVAEMLLRRGAVDDLEEWDRFIAALTEGNGELARKLLSQSPAFADRIGSREHGLLIDVAAQGNLAAVRLMLDLGFPVDVDKSYFKRWKGTALHHAAWHGCADVVDVLLKRGADPTRINMFGGDAFGAAIHGYISGNHTRGTAAIQSLAAVQSDDSLQKKLAGAEHAGEIVVADLLRAIIARRQAACGR